MITKLIPLCLTLSSSVFAQFGMDSIKPDVSFNADNDRFNVADMMMDKKMFVDTAVVEDDDSDAPDDGEFRRHYHSGEKYETQLDILQRKNPENLFFTRKADGGFAYDDRMDSAEGGTMTDFDRNLNHFEDIKGPKRRNMDYMDYSHGYRRYRRSLAPNPQDELLMQHAVPIVMKIDGFMKAPLND